MLRRLLLLWLLAAAAQAGVVAVPAGGAGLAEALAEARDGDVLRLAPGVHRGGVVVGRAVTLEGLPGAVVDGGGAGDVIRVRAAGVTIRNLEIRNSGKSLTKQHAGIFAERSAAGLRVLGNRFENNLFGIWVHAAAGPVIRGNRIHGAARLRSQDRGNGIHLFNVTDGVVEDNEIWGTRDGVYLDNTRGTRIARNRMHDLRFGVHYMYSQHNRLEGNRTTRTRCGYALMQSDHLTVVGNVSEDDENYGILMNYINYSEIRGNVVRRVRRGRDPGAGAAVAGAEGKALFIYNSVYNRIVDNVFADSEIGVHITAGSEDNVFAGNVFSGNRRQVKYVATRPQEWSEGGRGNYWSDYLGWDLDGDGIGEVPHEPNDGVDLILWRYPLARVFMHSPAVEVLRWAQRVFPVLRPPGVRDSHPLVQPPAPAQPS
ncbi:nitrous oxide reductase family maturation protein NosD [Inmirania thermothiophila]|nr:nitrous oxide reductase family maturation protein NosD [Inmirania thermothiophila]